ncbi:MULTISPECIES: hypothetical protein [unclassified Streptomyces]|uniref:hypothetical protein n=1 Tax=unclassified Streptomyces TaxID=2593676 RepID=UPI0011CD3AC5|nr:MULTISPECIES: hypothetical protein [unclassified Streptomyces]TXS76617.1 hypothetical protein EAO69_09525 [Streptomyces sp. me109]
MGGGQAGDRGVTRLLAVCAVLFGLFLMHGAPATAAGGCHGSMPATSSSMSGGHDLAPAAMRHAAPDTHQPGLSLRHADASGMSGELCVSTPAPKRIPLPAPGLLAVAAVAVSAFWMPAGLRAAISRTGRRGPPTGGRDLLLQACVART